jgi:hypothetical protein
MDPQAIAKVLPGCEQLETVGEDTYRATMKIGVAAVKGTYTGSVQLVDKTPPSAYRMLIDGSGSPGFVKGEAHVTLTPQGEQTVLAYEADTQVGGLIATVGQRIVGGAARLVVNQALKKLEEEVKQY